MASNRINKAQAKATKERGRLERKANRKQREASLEEERQRKIQACLNSGLPEGAEGLEHEHGLYYYTDLEASVMIVEKAMSVWRLHCHGCSEMFQFSPAAAIRHP